MELILKYFTNLTPDQTEKFTLLKDVYADWNSKINVISRKDMDSFYEHHVLHSLAIAQFIKFKPQTSIIDVGTGGGFPGIPLAIMFPEVNFMLLDSIGKKIKVVNAVAQETGITNVTAIQCRSEEHREKYDFIVSRAVTTLPQFVNQTRHLLNLKSKNAITNGVIYLKGGDISAEINPFKKNISVVNISDYYSEEFFKTKKLVHLSL